MFGNNMKFHIFCQCVNHVLL